MGTWDFLEGRGDDDPKVADDEEVAVTSWGQAMDRVESGDPTPPHSEDMDKWDDDQRAEYYGAGGHEE